MAYSGQSTPIPPPPAMGGNRTSMHTVAGANSNVGYTAGANLAKARVGYQNAAQRQATTGIAPVNQMSRGFFRNSAPSFSYKPGGIGQTYSQNIGNQVRGNTYGQTHASGVAPGTGYATGAQAVRQHTLNPGNGAEIDSAGQQWSRGPIAPPPPPIATTPAPSGYTTLTQAQIDAVDPAKTQQPGMATPEAITQSMTSPTGPAPAPAIGSYTPPPAPQVGTLGQTSGGINRYAVAGAYKDPYISISGGLIKLSKATDAQVKQYLLQTNNLADGWKVINGQILYQP